MYNKYRKDPTMTTTSSTESDNFLVVDSATSANHAYTPQEEELFYVLLISDAQIHHVHTLNMYLRQSQQSSLNIP